MNERRWTARAYRGEQMVCATVVVQTGLDDRVGLTQRERHRVTARFVENLDPKLRKELMAMVRQRGARARRVAEELEPITLKVDSGGARMCVIGKLQPPQIRGRPDLREVEFQVRESHERTPPPTRPPLPHSCGNPASANAA